MDVCLVQCTKAQVAIKYYRQVSTYSFDHEVLEELDNEKCEKAKHLEPFIEHNK